MALHAKNLCLSERSAEQHEFLDGIGEHVKMPFRIPYRTPKILLRVRHLDSFIKIVVYIHTRDPNELFASLLPEWLLAAIVSLENMDEDSDLESEETVEMVAQSIAKKTSYEDIITAGRARRFATKP